MCKNSGKDRGDHARTMSGSPHDMQAAADIHLSAVQTFLRATQDAPSGQQIDEDQTIVMLAQAGFADCVIACILATCAGIQKERIGRSGANQGAPAHVSVVSECLISKSTTAPATSLTILESRQGSTTKTCIWSLVQNRTYGYKFCTISIWFLKGTNLVPVDLVLYRSLMYFLRPRMRSSHSFWLGSAKHVVIPCTNHYVPIPPQIQYQDFLSRFTI